MMRPLLIAIFSLLLVLPATARAEKIKVVASFSIVGDMVREVAGDDIELKILVGPDGDAHVYEPTPADVRAVAAADLVIINGLGYEGWLPRLTQSSGYKGPVVAAANGIAPLDFSGEADPHAWQSLGNGKIYVGNIRDALVKADGARADDYRETAARYLKEMEKLDGWAKKEIARLPEDRRRIITAHDAFRYFARDYGVEFIAPLGVSTESEASAGDIARLIDQIRARKIHTLFMENITDPRLVRQLQADAGAVIGGTLYSDALSGREGPAATYLEMFRNNVRQLVKAMASVN